MRVPVARWRTTPCFDQFDDSHSSRLRPAVDDSDERPIAGNWLIGEHLDSLGGRFAAVRHTCQGLQVLTWSAVGSSGSSGAPVRNLSATGLSWSPKTASR